MTKEELNGKLLYLKHMRDMIKNEKEKLDLLDGNIQACMYQLKDSFCNGEHTWHKYGDYYSKWRICQKCGLEV